MVDHAIFNWFLDMRSQSVPLSASTIQENTIIFAKELSTENFQGSDGWLQRWKQRNNISIKTVFGEAHRWLMRGQKRPFQLFCQTMT